MPDLEPLLNSREICEYLKISKPTCLKLIHTGRLKAIKIGKGWRVLKSEVDKFVRGGSND